MNFITFLAATGFGDLITELSTIITSCFNLITGNWLLFALLAVSVGLPVFGAIFSFFKNRGG